MIQNNSFGQKIDNILHSPKGSSKPDDAIQEGTVLNINAVISNAIAVPEGNYIVAVANADRCVLIPTTEANRQQKFEVFKPTLAGFFNPEIHKKIIEPSNGETISEAGS